MYSLGIVISVYEGKWLTRCTFYSSFDVTGVEGELRNKQHCHDLSTAMNEVLSMVSKIGISFISRHVISVEAWNGDSIEDSDWHYIKEVSGKYGFALG